MTTKEQLEKELRELKENCKRARVNLENDFKPDSFELLEAILTNQTKYFVHSVKFGQIFPRKDREQFNRVCLYVDFQDNETMYISLPISNEKK